MKNLLFCLILLSFSFCFGQKPDGIKASDYDKNQPKIAKNKKSCKDKAIKLIDKEVIDYYCSDGYKYERTELYRGGTLKFHFLTNCSQKIEVHYHAVSGKFKEWFIVNI